MSSSSPSFLLWIAWLRLGGWSGRGAAAGPALPTPHRDLFAISNKTEFVCHLTFAFWFIPQWDEQIPLCSTLLLWLLQQQTAGLL